MDPLSDVLSRLRPSVRMVRGLEAGGDWSLRFPAGPGLRCYAILTGHCWLVEEAGEAAPVRLAAGDCILTTKGRATRLTSDPGLAPMDAVALLSTVEAGGLVRLGDGRDCSGLGGYFAFQGQEAALLLDLLPPMVHVRAPADRAALRDCLDQAMTELRARLPGGDLITEQLSRMVLIQALRLHGAQETPGEANWLTALSDRQIGAVLTAIHADPGRLWTLKGLAETAGLSRSSFALRFKTAVGTGALAYLTRWRMVLAADRLSQGRERIAQIALDLGYGSETAFRTAFKRVMGHTPGFWGRQDRLARGGLNPSDQEPVSLGRAMQTRKPEPLGPEPLGPEPLGAGPA